jgi:two-component system, NarL family, response regulator LiaR
MAAHPNVGMGRQELGAHIGTDNRIMPAQRITVFVVDDHPMVRTGLAAAIAAQADLDLVGEASNGLEALDAVRARLPNVVLMDITMPVLDGIETLKQLRPTLPSTRFLMLTSSGEPAEVRRALAAGASGYLLKNTSAADLAAMIRAAHAGRRVLAPEVTEAIISAAVEPTPGADLTARERELLALMARGMNNQEIAAELTVALPTVKFHVTNILSKLHVDNRTEAVLKALKHRIVPAP